MPVIELHTSIVQALASSTFTAVCEIPPVNELQASKVHAFPSSVFTAV